ncbi:MAG: ImmA/IrrE family metallo-endopeptidase [Planctomycetes bacterium]|nr:ImmA/IrrE family metallo-endopeptidase [Planctomycetota bacterium]
MDFARIPRYTAGEIEAKAHQFLKEKCKPIISIPIDIDFLIEQEPDTVLDCLPNLQDRFNVAGMVVKEPGRFVVYVDERVMNENPNFYRFTLAEELGHLHLHRQTMEGITSIEEAAALHEWEEYYEAIDRGAKRFAAAVLMPNPHIVEDAGTIYKELVSKAGFRDPSAILRYLVGQLSRRYVVSPTAMGIRLGEWPINVIEKVEWALKEKLDYLP